MDKPASDDHRPIGTVKAAVSMFGERLSDGTKGKSKTGYTTTTTEQQPSRTTDLHMAKRDVAKYRGRQRSADSVKIQAEAQLSQAKRAVKDLASQIEESNAKLISRRKDMEEEEEEKETPNPPATTPVSAAEEESDSLKSADYIRVMKELEFVKKELSKLKLGMATIMEEKFEAEKVSKQSNAAAGSAEAGIRKEIEEANEEQVLVELATIEALKEKQDIELLREKETAEFSAKAEETRKKINEALEEIDSSKEVESQLAVTLYDAAVLQNELKQARVMEKKIQRRGGSFGSSAGSSSSKRRDHEGGSSLLNSITKELEDAKRELETVKEEGIQFMSSMDIIRNELNHVKEEANRLKKAEEKTDLTVHNLKSKLLKGKSKLEAAISAEEKAKSVASNLSLTLQQLKTEAEIGKKEKDIIGEETEKIKAEIQKTDTEIDATEAKLEAAMEELETIKTKEASTMKILQNLVEDAMDARESALNEGNSTINLSKFEYDYLNGRAAKAEEIADMKVAAAQAWIEALKANEKEILMKIEIAHRELRETKAEEERSIVVMNTAAAGEGDVTDLKHQHRRRSNVGGRKKSSSETPRRMARASSSGTPTRMRLKLRNTEFSPSRTTPRSASVPMKKKSPMPNLSMMLQPQENR
ncbi:Protein PLASTID MOVEMENT IMPAIRED 2 [Linum grandiflorum]